MNMGSHDPYLENPVENSALRYHQIIFLTITFDKLKHVFNVQPGQTIFDGVLFDLPKIHRITQTLHFLCKNSMLIIHDLTHFVFQKFE